MFSHISRPSSDWHLYIIEDYKVLLFFRVSWHFVAFYGDCDIDDENADGADKMMMKTVIKMMIWRQQMWNLLQCRWPTPTSPEQVSLWSCFDDFNCLFQWRCRHGKIFCEVIRKYFQKTYQNPPISLLNSASVEMLNLLEFRQQIINGMEW